MAVYRFKSYYLRAVWSLQTMQELSVFPAEIIKMLALVDFKLIMNKVKSINAGNRTEKRDCYV